MADIVSCLARIGIACTVTVPNKVATVDIDHVSAERERDLAPHVKDINTALHLAGLLDNPWRAGTGGTTDRRWILILGSR